MPRSQKIFPISKNKENDDQIVINQNDSEEELRQVMNEICGTIGENIYKFKSEFQKSEKILEKNYFKSENNEYFMNINFGEIELIEENLDNLFYKFKEIKNDIAKARLANHYIQVKVSEKEFENTDIRSIIYKLNNSSLTKQ
jgi:hypothetical protein